MARNILRILLVIFGGILGAAAVTAVNGILVWAGMMDIGILLKEWAVILIYAAAVIIFAIIFYFISPGILDACARLVLGIETSLGEMSLNEIIFSSLGLIAGLLTAFLISTLTAKLNIGWIAFVIDLVLYVLCGYLGWSIVMKRRAEIGSNGIIKRGTRDKISKQSSGAKPKLLDTSVIIDGRIADICKTGIIEGSIIVPSFVLNELRHIADSSDSLKRSKGRRGLDILNRMKEDTPNIRVVENDYDDIAEVDAKLIRLAYDMGGVVVTNDYNLNKVAGVQQVPVFNINELANAVKPMLLPGEEMTVTIMKEGKEAGQGIAYLSDGTMIVVDGGRKFVGESVEVVVTSSLQTAAGRMIFAKVKNVQ